MWFHLNCWGIDWGSDDQRDQPGYVDPRLDPRCFGSSGGGGGGGKETVEPLEYALDLLAAVDWPDCAVIRTGDWNIGRILLLIETGRDVPEMRP